ncbi:MAG: hypothetical protein M1832_005277 [Thelocarpon impressellum]|nr:MAG: hypothetical protein M1832_005277 [Thelocarpon impressellum]
MSTSALRPRGLPRATRRAPRAPRAPKDPNAIRDRGRKPIFLPNFTLTLLRTPFLPPTMATFITPLNLNKLDLRSYLANAYGVRVNAVRSYVQQQRVRQDKPGARIASPRRWYRPRAIKKMTVEMNAHFAWPEEVQDFTPWDKDTYDKAREAQEAERDAYMPDALEKPPRDRKSIAEQAKRLLRGEDRWRPREEKEAERVEWEDVGEPVEVEVDGDGQVGDERRR